MNRLYTATDDLLAPDVLWAYPERRPGWRGWLDHLLRRDHPILVGWKDAQSGGGVRLDWSADGLFTLTFQDEAEQPPGVLQEEWGK